LSARIAKASHQTEVPEAPTGYFNSANLIACTGHMINNVMDTTGGVKTVFLTKPVTTL